MKNMNEYLDQYGFVVTKETNASKAGNSAQHTAMLDLLNYSLGKQSFEKSKENILVTWDLINRSDEPRLYWNELLWPGQLGHMSRDNLVAYICTLKVFGHDFELKELMKRIFKRAGFLWNTRSIGSNGDNKRNFPDFCGPAVWFIFFFGKWEFLDKIARHYLLICATMQVHRTRENKNQTDGHLNIFNLLEALRLLSKGNDVFLNHILAWYKETGVPQYAFKDYFGGELYAPIDELAVEVINTKWP